MNIYSSEDVHGCRGAGCVGGECHQFPEVVQLSHPLFTLSDPGCQTLPPPLPLCVCVCVQFMSDTCAARTKPVMLNIVMWMVFKQFIIKRLKCAHTVMSMKGRATRSSTPLLSSVRLCMKMLHVKAAVWCYWQEPSVAAAMRGRCCVGTQRSQSEMSEFTPSSHSRLTVLWQMYRCIWTKWNKMKDSSLPTDQWSQCDIIRLQ